MKFAQLREHKVKNIFLQKSYSIRGKETSFRFLFVFQKALYR